MSELPEWKEEIRRRLARLRHEIGVRIALGAQAKNVSKLVMGQGVTLTLIGVTIGLLGALALTRLMKSALFGVCAVAALLTCMAFMACYLPARRATKMDPMIALKRE